MTWSLTPLARTYEAALRDLTEKKPEVRASAVHDLVPYLRDHRDDVVRAAEKALSDESALVRRQAATVLGIAGAVTAIPELVAKSASDVDAVVRQMAMEALGAIDDERARAAVRRALTDEREEVRFQAVLAVLHFPDDGEAVQALVRALTDGDRNIRYVAVRTAEERGFAKREEVREAVARCLDDESAEVRVAAALFLAEVDPARARGVVLDVVTGALKTRERDDFAHALEIALDVVGEPARAHLEKRAHGFSLFPDGSALPAQVALAKHGEARSRDKILKGLAAKSPERRLPYVIAAGRARVREARELVAGMEDLPEDVVEDALREMDR